VLLAAAILLAPPLGPTETEAMQTSGILVEWTMTTSDPAQEPPDVTVFEDGRVRLGPRLAGGGTSWHQLSQTELSELHRLLTAEPQILNIDARQIQREVSEAAERQMEALRSTGVEPSPGWQMDAGTSVFRLAAGGRTRDIRYYNLFGDAQRYPEVTSLQRLRSLELELLRIADESTQPK
jgi:hypothetical protein